MPGIVRPLLALALLAFLSTIPHALSPMPRNTPRPVFRSKRPPSPQEKPASLRPSPRKVCRREDQEENANLKYAAPVRWLARKTGWSVHQAYMLALGLNFAIIVVIVFWAARKFVPGMLRNRSASIQQALEEARAASQDAQSPLSRHRESSPPVGC